MASASTSQNPKSDTNKPSKVREEGELTSSDDDVRFTSSVPPSSGVSAPSTCVPNVSGNTNVQEMKSGNAVSANVPARSADRAGYHKGFKNKAPLKSKNPVWRASDTKSNLVISFSDDEDSSSDDDERRRNKSQATDRPPLAVKGIRKPPAMSYLKPDLGTARKEGKVAPKKVSLSRTFVSSMNKIHGSSVRNGGPSLSELRSKNSKTGKILSQDFGCSKNVELSSSKLQELRHQITLYEDELRRKREHKSKENVSDSCQDVNAMTQNDTFRKRRELHSDTQIREKESENKRLKIGSSDCGRPSSSACHLKPAYQGGPIADLNHDDSAPGVTVGCSPSDWGFLPVETLNMSKQTTPLSNSPIADCMDKSSQGVVDRSQPSNSAVNQDMHGNSIIKINHQHVLLPTWEKSKSASSSLRPRSLQVSENKLGSPDAYPDNTTLLQSLGGSTVLGYGDVDVRSLFEIEELHDKELEEAQEHRRRCEVEERNTLQTYRRAQRALADANAHCAYLYRRRELYSAQLRSLVMEDSSLLWSSSQQRQIGETLNMTNTVVDGGLDLKLTSTDQIQGDFEAGNRLGYDSNAQSADGYVQYGFLGNENGYNLGSEACSEPDASSSEMLVRGNSSAVNAVHSRSIDQNLSPNNDDGTFPLDHRVVYANITSSREEENTKESEKNVVIDSTTNLSADGLRDPLLLEAYLRSALFSRLGVTDSTKHNDIDTNNESAVARVEEEDVAGAGSQMMQDHVSLSNQVSNGDLKEGATVPEDSMSKGPLIIHDEDYVEQQLSKDLPVPMLDTKDCGFYIIDIPSSSILKNAMKAISSVTSDNTQIMGHSGSPDACNGEEMLVQCDRGMVSLDTSISMEDVSKHGSFGKIGLYTWKSIIDPSWPLCMYELRGKCNNDECPWQHVKDNLFGNVDQHDSVANADGKNEASSNRQMQRECTELSSSLTPPRYLVCLDSLKTESTSSSFQARHLGSSQKSALCISLAVSSSLLKHLPSDEPYLHGNDGCLELPGSGYPLHFHCRNGTGKSLRNGVGGNDQALEVALHVLNQEINKVEGTKKALSLLSRALEADPCSLPLWIMYLVLYHCNKSAVGSLHITGAIDNDDLFSCAVKHNERSYELWLLYINSRGRLSDRFAAYERALSCMCHHATDNDGHVLHASAAILDLFLQMMYCFCMSGNVAMAVQRICGLVLTDRDPDESHSLLLSDILECLTISDKCIFWICCVYLVLYRKLPDEMVQQLEFEKALVVMEWPSVRVALEEKQQVSKMMEVALDSLGLLTNTTSLESNILKSAQMFVVNHVKLMLAIDGKESYMTLLERYKNSYPTCLELALLLARARTYVGEFNFQGFEDTLCVWPNEVPGIQCIWNQYLVFVLENGRTDMIKEISNRWFHSVWKPHFLQNQSDDVENGDRVSPEDLVSGSHWNGLLSSGTGKIDLVFGLLNLSLYRLINDDVQEAQLAIDKALSVSDCELFGHCIRYHAVFLFNNGSQLKKDVSVCGLVEILKSYTIHALSITPPREPLTKKFVNDLQKPRLRQLVSCILSPISSDSHLVNSVLDIWYGSTFLPQKPNVLKDLVDFVEAILEVSPANYELVLSVCRYLCSDSISCDAKSASVLFWASSLLVNTIYQAIPLPPEYVWVEAAGLLGKLTKVPEISESFHQRALSVYPFSLKLWKSFCDLSTASSKKNHVMELAGEKGIKLD